MTHTTTTARAVRGGLLAATALFVACAAPAQATVRGPEPAGDWLLLTVTRGDTRSGSTEGTLLLCDPPRGHAHADLACAELDRAGGDIAAVPLRETHCPMIYSPVTAHAHGQWRGRPVEYTRTFPNTCVLAARTGAVFALAEDPQAAPAPAPAPAS
ncbi:SSI family serine proteinase inhibitor [Streptomyces fumanus]|uniref:SSI family serine proteinase inhibitor n=1 Tax=Streptomyces fumanus TaxID=67302 RepID=UPI00340A26FB